MSKRALKKDFYMEIKKSPGRFFSILFIVALGVAFLSGIRASEPDMRITGDSYFDSSKLMDVKALSTYGVTGEDVEAIGDLDVVEQAEGAYSADFLYNLKEDQHVIHVMGLQKEMNRVTVTEGRLPEKTGECMADDESGYEIGDVITLSSGTEDPVSETLRTDRLEIVGLGNSPCYLSYGRGNAGIGSGGVDAFLVVPEETFDREVYSEVYVKVAGAEKLLAFTDPYEERVEEAMEQVEKLAKDRAVIRRQEIVDEAEEELSEAREDLKEGKDRAQKELADAWEEIEEGEKKLSDGRAEIKDGKKKLSEAKKLLHSKQKELDQAKEEYQSGKKELEKGKKEYQKGVGEYEKTAPAAEKQIEDGRRQADALKAQIAGDEKDYGDLQAQIEKLQASLTGQPGDDTEAVRGQIEELQKQAGGLLQKIEMEKQAYSAAEAELDRAQRALNDGRAELDRVKKELESAEKKLAKASRQIESGQSQLEKGWEELKQQEKKLKEGEKEIASNAKKLEDAKKAYEKGKKEAEEEIRDGEKKISDAEEEIAEIKEPKWYVYDRNILVEYTGFGENAERLGAIGKVFPVLFFLVAALISLTSMTRMVEEQRISIGTLKALGYSKSAIASKYLGYALLATVGGSILGVAAGEKILPYIIIYAYSILYRHLPEILVPYNWAYAALASGAAVVCTTFATFLACYRELRAQPAVLMRPPTPKNGRRVFMERLGLLWKHLSFTWKSTIRNLMRYKKRFFMTVFGIGGCMALMLVGFGLKDSCYEIAEIQYAEISTYNGSIYLEEDITESQRAAVEERIRAEDSIGQSMDAELKSITLVNGKIQKSAYQCVMAEAEKIPEYVDFHDRKTKESYTLSDSGVIISEKTAKMLGVTQGDTVEIKDEENGNKKIKIDHICENYMGHYIYLTPAYYQKVYAEAPEYHSIFFIAKDGDDREQMEKAGQNILKEDGVVSVSYTHDIEKQLDDMLRSLNLVIIVLIISAGMLAFVVLYNLNTVNIAERKRELATLKVLGFYNREVAAYVYRENILLTFVGALAGVVLGRFLHLFIIQTVEVESAMFGRNINLPSYLYSLLFTLAFSMIVNGVMYFKLKKIDMVESLKSVE